MALVSNYILHSSEFCIENGQLKPIGNKCYKRLNINEDFTIKTDIDNQPAFIEFMNIHHEVDLIPFSLKRGIPARDFRPYLTDPIRHYDDVELKEFFIETNLLLNDAKLMRWLVRLSKFLQGSLTQDIDAYPDEETIQHLCNHFIDNSCNLSADFSHLINLSPGLRLDYAINQLSDTESNEVECGLKLTIEGKIVASDQKMKSTPEAILFARDILNDVARYVCKSIYRAPNFFNDGTAFWNIYESSLVPRLFYELFEKLIAANDFIHNCPVCGSYFTGREKKTYCSITCKKTQNLRTFRKPKDDNNTKTSAGRKRKPKAGV